MWRHLGHLYPSTRHSNSVPNSDYLGNEEIRKGFVKVKIQKKDNHNAKRKLEREYENVEL